MVFDEAGFLMDMLYQYVLSLLLAGSPSYKFSRVPVSRHLGMVNYIADSASTEVEDVELSG